MKITGNMVNYYFVCARKLWLFSHQIQFENENENVRLGKILDEKSYGRNEKHVMLDNVVNLDMIENWSVIHEIKKTRAIEPAAEWQLKYYMYYLEQKEIQVTKGILDYPKLKQRFEYHLTEKDRKKLQSYMENIKEIVRRKTAPKVISQSICKSCAYYEYCYV
ncbi:MAG: CRISPR-associated protein Cas4 [Liquorilactobacillus nagelii]|jgi:CRISPR-associated exonuclease Cas4|uniref:CRISPR-associated exonuclease Cas4 n=1 Tax=Liquorilactobacillus nagelii TaxID=82688 RepID=A0A3Q8CCS8_9LACO|nr:CRISPR-associated protein Cas4 [Liquorilactobacillus nagelii]AUJ32822.1 CRISPR-associated protein Cas4 [Liquorilactobacillus nagelii]MCC7616435.1 CRISPR-associated protein Cas4 [Liquorilactobacillus nagelii]MCP9315193.1 CRISPR-associated protein Cas4 [Liquorilactobacillus nagelii]